MILLHKVDRPKSFKVDSLSANRGENLYSRLACVCLRLLAISHANRRLHFEFKGRNQSKDYYIGLNLE